jgi:hypothetical protein
MIRTWQRSPARLFRFTLQTPPARPPLYSRIALTALHVHRFPPLVTPPLHSCRAALPSALAGFFLEVRHLGAASRRAPPHGGQVQCGVRTPAGCFPPMGARHGEPEQLLLLTSALSLSAPHLVFLSAHPQQPPRFPSAPSSWSQS